MTESPSPPRPTPPVLLHQELQALTEVLDIARRDLHQLLRCDHLPLGHDVLIEHERNVVADLEWLVHDARSKIAMRELAELRLI